MSRPGESDEHARRAAVEASLDPDAPADYRRVAAALALAWQTSRPRRVGLGGGQGAGKSTLAKLIVQACEQVGIQAVALGIDDFYRTRAERETLSRTVHPLFETRGVPGTHEMGLLRTTIEALLASEPGQRCDWPRFDKGLDDRRGTQSAEGPFDLVLLEGWCVGAEAAGPEALEPPINRLERARDAEGVWRQAVDAALARDYAPLWSGLDALVFLAVPDLDAVRRWRLQQEEARPPAQRLDAVAIARFVEHYERITLRMLRTLPARADWVVTLGAEHQVEGLRRSSDRPGERDERRGGNV